MKEPGYRCELDIVSISGRDGTTLLVLGLWSLMAVCASTAMKRRSSRASATGEKVVRSAYIGWIATLPIVPSVSP